MQHYMSGESIIEEIKEDISVELSEEDKEIATQIEDLLETRVRPSVASHGGDIVFHSYSEGIVELEMRGACSGCPSSMATLKMGVENMLKHYIPEIMDWNRGWVRYPNQIQAGIPLVLFNSPKVKSGNMKVFKFISHLDAVREDQLALVEENL